MDTCEPGTLAHTSVHLPCCTRLHIVATSSSVAPVVTGRRTTRTAFGASEALRATWGALWAFLRAAIGFCLDNLPTHLGGFVRLAAGAPLRMHHDWL